MTEYEKGLKKRLREVVAELASGALLRLDDDNYWILVRDLKQPQGDVIDHLMHCGWLESMPNGGTCKISDAGKIAYLRSTDELGDGQLVAPHEWMQS